MSKAVCPSETSLLSFVDDDLPPEAAGHIRVHVSLCARCRDAVATLAQLRADLRAPLPGTLEVAAHVQAVMSAVDAAEARPKPRTRFAPRMAAVALAASGLLSVGYLALREQHPAAQWQARGGGVASIARDVGVQVYANEMPLRPLQPGAAVPRHVPFTAGFRNLGTRPVSLLLFAVDARQTLHWISPSYTRAEDDPRATQLAPTLHEQLLPTTVVFDDLAPGTLRLISVISDRPAHVSDIEALSASGLDSRAITQRLPSAEVRETVIRVADSIGAENP